MSGNYEYKNDWNLCYKSLKKNEKINVIFDLFRNYRTEVFQYY